PERPGRREQAAVVDGGQLAAVDAPAHADGAIIYGGAEGDGLDGLTDDELDRLRSVVHNGERIQIKATGISAAIEARPRGVTAVALSRARPVPCVAAIYGAAHCPIPIRGAGPGRIR